MNENLPKAMGEAEVFGWKDGGKDVKINSVFKKTVFFQELALEKDRKGKMRTAAGSRPEWISRYNLDALAEVPLEAAVLSPEVILGMDLLLQIRSGKQAGAFGPLVSEKTSRNTASRHYQGYAVIATEEGYDTLVLTPNVVSGYTTYGDDGAEKQYQWKPGHKGLVMIMGVWDTIECRENIQAILEAVDQQRSYDALDPLMQLCDGIYSLWTPAYFGAAEGSPRMKKLQPAQRENVLEKHFQIALDSPMQRARSKNIAPKMQKPVFGDIRKAQAFQRTRQTINKCLSLREDWDPDTASLIPVMGDEYIIPKELQFALDLTKAKMEADERPPKVLLAYGPAGTGKTALARAYFAALNLPECIVTCNADLELNDLLGCYESTKGSDGANHLRFKESQFVRALEEGWGIEIQEPTVSRPSVFSGLNALLEREEGQITLPNGRIVRRHPNTRFVITTNLDYEGCEPMNQAVIDRADLALAMDPPTVKVMCERAMSVSGFDDYPKAMEMAKVITAIMEQMDDEGMSEGVCGVRSLISWMEMSKVSSPYDTFPYAVLNKAGLKREDRELLRQIIENSALAPHA